MRIFRDHAAGISPKAIAASLNREGTPGPRDAGWSQITTDGNRRRGTGVLNNELYIGRLVWNRLRYEKDPDTENRRSQLNPESEWPTRLVPAYSDEAGRVLRFQAGHQSDVKPATVPI